MRTNSYYKHAEKTYCCGSTMPRNDSQWYRIFGIQRSKVISKFSPQKWNYEDRECPFFYKGVFVCVIIQRFCARLYSVKRWCDIQHIPRWNMTMSEDPDLILHYNLF